jgi:hypothetical protein
MRQRVRAKAEAIKGRCREDLNFAANGRTPQA